MPRLAIDPSEIRLPDYGARQRIDGANDSKLRSIIAGLSADLAKAQAAHVTALAEVGIYKRRYRALADRHDALLVRHEALAMGGDVTPCRKIALEIAEKHGMTLGDIMGVSRLREIAYVRHEAFYECVRRRHDMSVVAIGQAFRRDHTTVMWGVASHIERNGLPKLTRCNVKEGQRTERQRAKVIYNRAYRAAKKAAL